MKQPIDFKYHPTIELDPTDKFFTINSLMTIGALAVTATPILGNNSHYKYATTNEHLEVIKTYNGWITDDIHQHIKTVSSLLAQTNTNEISDDLLQVDQLLIWLTELASYLMTQQNKMQESLDHS
jgi:hypothetical protein